VDQIAVAMKADQPPLAFRNGDEIECGHAQQICQRDAMRGGDLVP
jgi:hypothetical protein